MPVQRAAAAGMLHERFEIKPASTANAANGSPLYRPKRMKVLHPPHAPMPPCRSITNSIHGQTPAQKMNPAAQPKSARRFQDFSRAQAIRIGVSATGARKENPNGGKSRTSKRAEAMASAGLIHRLFCK